MMRHAPWSRKQFQCAANRANDICQVGFLGRIDVDPLADVERRQFREQSKAPRDFCGGRFAVEVPGMAPPLKEPARCHFQCAGAMDVDHVVRGRVEPVRGSPRV